jgi:MoaA/NifB/PqqE/SkfB family radical SAM enzyme
MQYGKILWGVNFVSTKTNLGKALATAQVAERLGASYFNLIKFSPTGRGVNYREALEISYTDFRAEEESLSQVFSKMGVFYGDIHLFDLAGVLQHGMTSYFDSPEFAGVPSGISINSSGSVDLTPASVHLGNCREESIRSALLRLSSQEVQAGYADWLMGRKKGVHQIQKAS